MVDFSKQHIFVLDDEPFMNNLITQTLYAMGIQKVSQARSVDEAVDVLANKGGIPDLFLVDLEMPEKTGFDFIKLLKTGETAAPGDRPVIILTGRADSDGVMTAKKLGVNNYLLKPVSKASLEQRLKAVLDSA